MFKLSSERRWLVMQLIIAVNLLILGLAFAADYAGLSLDAFTWAAAGFQSASAILIAANYGTKPTE